MGNPDTDWFRSWVVAHCHSFGITNPDQVAVFASWRSALIGLDSTAGELAECTRLCLMDAQTPEWPREHLAAIKRHLGGLKESARRKAEAAAKEPAGGYGICSACGNSGLVVVPHPRCVQGGTWQPAYRTAAGIPVYHTVAVTCRCFFGSKQVRADKPILTLAAYEEKSNAAWREHLAERDEAERAMIRAEDAAWNAERLGKLPNVRRMLSGIGTPVGGPVR